ncbi:Autophagy-related protein 17 [Trichoderma ghanense]|uniref:Autophagy-related protein 17 n=1 Tax=Trichoderma ghanense TaxID=65468 RepID=A0ABY2GQ29_9HYPO
MASPATSTRRSLGSSSTGLPRPSGDNPTISIDTLVSHLLRSKRSLSSITLVLRAEELIRAARNQHEETVVLMAQTKFLRAAITDQAQLLSRLAASLQATNEWGKKDFFQLLKHMDDVDAQLKGTMDMLRETPVDPALRPPGEESKNLMDFVDEASVGAIQESMRACISELQAIQVSFDGDLLRLETDIRNTKKIMDSAPIPAPPNQGMSDMMLDLFEHSTVMAESLASLTRHFDMCVTAVRTTEGAAALARRMAAEATQTQGSESVSISGVIAEQESNKSDLEPQTAQDRAEMLRVVIQDADMVEDVVRDIQEHLAQIELKYSVLQDVAERTRAANAGILDAFTQLSEVSHRLASYQAAEDDFLSRWAMEKEVIFAKIEEMTEMRAFYEGYASAYHGLLIEVARRQTVEDKVQATLRKAQETVDKMLEADRAERETFRQEVGEFLPTDLWADMQGSVRRWKIVQDDDEQPADANRKSG